MTMAKENPDDIVIAGLSCRLPESDNIDEFWCHLINNEDMVTEDGRRWQPGLHGLPKRNGKLKDLKHFDAAFFGVHAKQAHHMDPQLRLLLEVTYETLIDAGIEPQSVRNSRTGVFIGTTGSEAGEAFSSNAEDIDGYDMIGCCPAMFANRVSFAFDFKGPSFSVNTACSSSLLALDCAVQAMKSGTCNAAIVGGVCLTLKPNTSLSFLRLSMLSPDGACKSFDESGNGYCRSEGAVAIYIVKRSVAKRIYANIVNSKNNSDGYKQQGVTYPNGAAQKELLKEVYAEVDVNPADVSYMEAHGTGTKTGDPEEVNAITDVFCAARTSDNPLLIGSVKSNMGHSEGASGLAGVTKVLLSMQHGILPANLHYKNPNPNIPALIDGRVKVVNEPTKWRGGIVGVNSFGFGGSNVHVILQSPNLYQTKPHNKVHQVCVPLSGRTKEAVEKLVKLVNDNPDDMDLFSLLGDISATPTNTFQYRGYVVVGCEGTVKEVNETKNDKRPVWFVCSGMGTQWNGMGKDLMQVPLFKKSICTLSKYVKEYGIDLEKFILESDEDTYKSTINSFVAIASIQAALIDCLKSQGLEPDGIIGHSVGELAGAYADGSLNAEELVKAAYWRGRCISEANQPAGAMAVVSLTWEEAKSRCPPGVVPACHNAKDTVTISGDASVLEKFIEELKDEKIFTKKVNTVGVAFHSHHMAAIAPQLKSHLDKFIVPKRRSSRWISTSIPEERWNSDLAQYSSADYHVNNLVSPVLFQEALEKIPKNAIVIEIAPHCLLQAVLKRSLNSDTTCIPLQTMKQQDNLQFFLANLGNIYMQGKNIVPTLLTCEKHLPVRLSTPSISPHMGWDHSQEWDVPTSDQFRSNSTNGVTNSSQFVIDLSSSSNDYYLEGHCVNGRVLFPAAGYLVLAWRALAKSAGLLPEQMPVTFEDVRIHRATILPKTSTVTLTVHLMPASNKFEVSEGDSLSVTGTIYIPDPPVLNGNINVAPQIETEVPLSSECIYKELRLRGYDYGPTFQGIKRANSTGTKAELVWNDNWTTFLDTMQQVSVLRLPTRCLRLPTRIRSLTIDPSKHLEIVKSGVCEVNIDARMDVVVAGGVEMCGLHASVAPKRDIQTPILETIAFVPYIDVECSHPNEQQLHFQDILSHGPAMKLMLDIVIENTQGKVLSVCEMEAAKNRVYSHVVPIINSHPLMHLKYKATDKTQKLLSMIEKSATEKGVDVSCWNPLEKPPTTIGKVNLVISTNVSQYDENILQILEHVKSIMSPQGFLLLHESSTEAKSKERLKCMLEKAGLGIASMRNTFGSYNLILCRLFKTHFEKPTSVIDIHDSFEWIHGLQSLLNKGEESSIWLRANTPNYGIVGMTHCLRHEPSTGERIRCLFDASNDGNDLMKDFEKIRKLDLFMNVYKHGEHGSYRHLPMVREQSLKQTEHAYVNVLTRGDLSSLRWITSHMKYAPRNEGNSNFCTVYYSSLNFRDIMLATGKLPMDALPGDLADQECILGMEFAGKDNCGKRIMGLLPAQALATTVLADQRFTWEVPNNWSLLEAATVPISYSTAYYALIVRGNLQPGQSVLVHSGSGGVGQAAISICLSMRCEVYTTVGFEEKKDYLLATFLKLKPENIGNSRDLSFELMILHGTNGRGVDVVLNSLAKEKLQASLRCLARHGRFLEIGKYDMSDNTHLGMAVFLKNISFHGILLDAIFEEDNTEWKDVSDLVFSGIASGTVIPLKTTLFDHDQVEQAFRFMAQGKHVGKVVIQVRPEQSWPSDFKLNEQIRSMCNPKMSYVITGGLGGFGLEIAHWLVERGAKHLVLTSRRGICTGYQARMVKLWQDQGVQVKLSTKDVGTNEGAQAIIKEAQSLGKLGGIFHLAMELRDSLFVNQTPSTFREVCKPKYHGAMFLDNLTRKKDIARYLHWFVAFSSVFSGHGNAGQSNYSFANSGMERICEKRVEDGLPGLAIQWGSIGDVGLIQEKLGGTNETVISGRLPQRMSSCLSVLDRFLSQAHPVVSSYVLAAKHEKETEKSSHANLASSVARILGVNDAGTINPNTTLIELGLDSLMGVEVRQMLERDFGIQLAMKEVQSLTMNSASVMHVSRIGTLASV